MGTAREHQGSEAAKRGISPQFIERLARSAADVPESFRVWNAERAARGARLRERIAAIVRDEPAVSARDVRDRLLEAAHSAGALYDARGRRMVPGKRAIQRHMLRIRRTREQIVTRGISQPRSASGSARPPARAV